MSNVITERGFHRQRIQELLRTSEGPIRIASAYVTDTEALQVATSNNVQLLLALSTMDIVSGATSIDSLEKLIARGVQCRFMSAPRLHAKVYIFGEVSALVTSANLTASALDSNIEVGVFVGGNEVIELIEWFNESWDVAEPLDALFLSRLKKQTAALRMEFSLLRAQCQPPGSATTRAASRATARQDSSPRYFICNTDRAHSDRTTLGRFELEELMQLKKYAAAWETFSYPSHMKQVARGDIIFMYANRKGIIAIGKAKDKCESLPFGTPGRIYNGTDSTEWRVPVDWLVWEEDHARLWTPHADQTFVNVSSEKYIGRRDIVIEWLQSIETLEQRAE